MSAVITKSRGACWRFMAVDATTGEILGETQTLPALTRRLWRAGYGLKFQMVRP